MSRLYRQIALVFLFAFAGSSVQAFSLLGPQEPYHVDQLGYFPQGNFRNWPKNLDDEYRWNTRVVYYSFDPEFTSYFGSNGIAAVDQAFDILNGLTNVSDYSSDLTEFPLEAQSVNYSAEALQLFDVRSVTLSLIVEHLGLADPEDFTWTLRVRSLPSGASCPNYQYLVIKRNFDPITLAPSSYVNGNLLTYQIFEFCPTPDRADAIEFLVDPLARRGSSVATFGVGLGEFWQGLTRDDIGGLRYLLSTNNLNWETTPDQSFVISTNTSQPVLLFPSNLQLFAEQAITNDAAALQGLYPGLDVTGSSNYFTNVVITNTFSYLTNFPGDPVGSAPTLVTGTTLSTNVEIRYVHSFGNVLTNEVVTNCVYSLLTTNIAPPTYAPPGSGISVTNVTLQTLVDEGCLSGSFFILPTNVCDYMVLSTQLTEVVTSTNLLTNTLVTNLVTYTNLGTADYYESSQSIVRYFTNQILTAYPVNCPDAITSLFEGIEKVTFVRRDFDSLLGQFFEPVTNNYVLTEITNNVRVNRFVERAITSPDFLFTADDLVSDPTANPIISPAVARTTPNYQNQTNVNNLGPGTISASSTFVYNKVGPAFFAAYPFFIDEATAILDFIWGSFDGTTNAPIVYPVGTDLMSIESSVVFQLTSPTTTTNNTFVLPDASVGAGYSFQLEAIGGVLPYTWTLSPGSAGLPAGLTLSTSGAITGIPTVGGIYDFSIRLTDNAGRNVDYPFTLTVAP
jgi:hypothetical protein